MEKVFNKNNLKKNKMMKKWVLIFFCLLVGISHAQTTHVVEAGMLYYSPKDLQVSMGDTVFWTNVSGYHDVNFQTNSLTGESFGNPQQIAEASLPPTAISSMGSIVFNIAGVFNYDCSVGNHAASGMVGSIIVSEEADCIDDDASMSSLFSGGASISSCEEAFDYLAGNYSYSISQSCSWDGLPMFDFNQMVLSDYCVCSCENTLHVDQLTFNNWGHYLYTTDILGRKVSKNVSEKIVFDHYSSGKVIKRFRLGN